MPSDAPYTRGVTREADPSATPPAAPGVAAPPTVDANERHPLTDELVASFASDPRIEHLGTRHLPRRDAAIAILEHLRRLTFPGFFEAECIDPERLDACISERLHAVHALLYDQIRQALRYRANLAAPGSGDDSPGCDTEAAALTERFLGRVVEVRRLLGLDVQAAFDGDPASGHTDEAVFCYPGIDALFTHRYAHELYRLGVPLMPRIMSEVAHGETGIDIHPGATIGESCFIDHGTGIVIGETARLGARVKLYQGVTLGALSLRGGHDRWAGKRRHPTLGDDVTIYAGAVILGGDTHIGDGATIGGSVFLTESVPAGQTVVMADQRLRVSAPRSADAFDPGI